MTDDVVLTSKTDRYTHCESEKTCLFAFDLSSKKSKRPVTDIVAISVKWKGSTQIISLYLKNSQFVSSKLPSGSTDYIYRSKDGNLGCTTCISDSGVIDKITVEIDFLNIAMLCKKLNKQI